MHDVLIGAIESYENNDAIRNFIDTAFRADKALDEIFGDSEKHRLVVVKPNWVQEAHDENAELWEPVITHPSIVLAVVESLAEKMGGQGTICICDAPHTYASFRGILARGALDVRLDGVRHKWPALNLEVSDLRREIWTRREEVIVERRPSRGDPRGHVQLDLGQDSLLYRYPGEGRYYGADYDASVVNDHHRGERQEYLLAATPLLCDLFINLPKLKTHKKTGITCSLKNLVGINADKNWLPHYAEGCPKNRGDEFPGRGLAHSLERRMKHVGQHLALHAPLVGTWMYRKMRRAGVEVFGSSANVIRNGNWSGNDTCWRMALDLNRCLLYGNPDGTWRERDDPRPCLIIVDGIVGGEGDGPLCPDPVPSNVLVAGIDPAEVDAVAARLMGFDPGRIPIIARAFDAHRWPIARSRMMDEITIFDGRVGRTLRWVELAPAVKDGFVPHFGWNSIRNPKTEDGLSV